MKCLLLSTVATYLNSTHLSRHISNNTISAKTSISSQKCSFLSLHSYRSIIIVWHLLHMSMKYNYLCHRIFFLIPQICHTHLTLKPTPDSSPGTFYSLIFPWLNLTLLSSLSTEEMSPRKASYPWPRAHNQYHRIRAQTLLTGYSLVCLPIRF